MVILMFISKRFLWPQFSVISNKIRMEMKLCAATPHFYTVWRIGYCRSIAFSGSKWAQNNWYDSTCWRSFQSSKEIRVDFTRLSRHFCSTLKGWTRSIKHQTIKVNVDEESGRKVITIYQSMNFRVSNKYHIKIKEYHWI